MAKNKMIKKVCPKCSLQVAVASKTCRCGHSFTIARRAAAAVAVPATVVSSDPVKTEPIDESEGIGEGIVKRRRTERVKREKPNYYDALEFEKQVKKRQRTRNRSSGSLEGVVDHHSKKEDVKSNKQPQLKRRQRGKVKMDRNSEEKEAVMPVMSPSKGAKCGVILAEINRRIGSASWRI